jgi:hypothetical protein
MPRADFTGNILNPAVSSVRWGWFVCPERKSYFLSTEFSARLWNLLVYGIIRSQLIRSMHGLTGRVKQQDE